jgi:nickel-dependent lactate racemase
MLKFKTVYEQVPLTMVQRMLEEQLKQRKMADALRATENDELIEDLLEAGATSSRAAKL